MHICLLVVNVSVECDVFNGSLANINVAGVRSYESRRPHHGPMLSDGIIFSVSDGVNVDHE